MRYQVPQFIEVEDKIFGPFTFKQFAYMAGGAGISFVIYKALPIYVGIFFIVPIIALVALLTFYKVNNRPFIEVMESAIKFWLGNKLYIWHKAERTAEDAAKEREKQEADIISSSIYVPKLSQSKLKDLTWSLDVNETIYSREAKKMQQGANINSRKPL